MTTIKHSLSTGNVCAILISYAYTYRYKPTVPIYCQIWYEETPEPDLVKVVEYKYIWIKGRGSSLRMKQSIEKSLDLDDL